MILEFSFLLRFFPKTSKIELEPKKVFTEPGPGITFQLSRGNIDINATFRGVHLLNMALR